MKPLTGLPPSVYLQTAEEGKVPLADLLQLVQALEAGNTPAYLARYRPDLAAGCDEISIVRLQERLRMYLDMEDRRVLVLSAIGQAGELTPELRATLESTCDRDEIEDLYTKFKAKRRMPAEDAADRGLAPLADFLEAQEPPDADIEAEAAKFVDSEKGVPDPAAALAGARHIIARRISDCPKTRPELRKLALAEARLQVLPGEKRPKDEHKKKLAEWSNNPARAAKIGWRQMLAVRRAVRDGWATQEIALPFPEMAAHLSAKLVRSAESPFAAHLAAAAELACGEYLNASLAHDVEVALNERVDRQAVDVAESAMERLLMTPGAGAISVIGIETGRSGGWRAAVIDKEGNFVTGGTLGHPFEDRKPKPENSEEAVAAGAPELLEKQVNSAEAEAVAPVASVASAEAAGQGQEADQPDSPSDAAPSSAEAVTEQAPLAGEPAVAAPNVESSPGESGPAADATACGVAAAAEADTDDSGTNESDADDEPAESAAEHPEVSIDDRRKALAELIKRFEPAAIAYANGPQTREIERFIRSAIRESGVQGVFWAAVNDAGSWIYATSKVARRELPRIDSTVRSAATLARRLRDPLSELVKLDGRPVGVGPFHHDIESRRLRIGLRTMTEDCVHRVGVDLNTASISLLAMVPGITDRVAKRIVEYRKKKGKFSTRQALRKVPGLSERIFEQAAGFLRVRDGENPLDATGIHPHAYAVVEKMLAAAGVAAAEALEKPETLEALDLAPFQSNTFPLARLRAIVREFQPGVREPRGKFERPALAVELRNEEELKVGAVIEGVITNVAKFGAFVDIGGDQDGLVHLSQLPLNASKDIESALKAGDTVSVRIVALAEDGKRISLSMREPRETAPRQRPAGGGDRFQRAGAGGGRGGDNRRDSRSRGDSRGPREFGGRGDRGDRSRGPQRERAASSYIFGPDKKEKERELRESQSLPMEDKLALLAAKFRTKV